MEDNTSKNSNGRPRTPERNQLVTLDDLATLKIDLLKDIGNLLQPLQSTNHSKRWLPSREVRKMLGVSAGTLQTLRVNGTLPFTKVGTIWLYNEGDIIRILESNKGKS